jgi:uncharacterized radical SAM superfamily protein
MHYYYPGKKFPAISVTGPHCEVMCPHCQGHYLNSMIWAETPERLIAVCRELEKKGCIGCLISGGCNLDGTVPLPLDAIQLIREETDLILNLHTGMVQENCERKLRKINPHYISFEIPTPHVLEHLYRLPLTQEDYFKSLTLLEGLNVVPHLMVGLDGKEERETLKTVEKMGFSALILIVFTPTRGTALYGMKVDTKEVIRTFKTARTLFSHLILGCMRPRIKALEEAVLLFDGIVLPTPWAKEKVEQAGMPIEIKNTCCAVE